MNKTDRVLNDAFTGIIAELLTWYNLGTDDQKDKLIQGLRYCADILDEEMPNLEEEDI